MRSFLRGIATLLAASMLTAGMFFTPVYAEETEAEPGVTQETAVSEPAASEETETTATGASEETAVITPAETEQSEALLPISAEDLFVQPSENGLYEMEKIDGVWKVVPFEDELTENLDPANVWTYPEVQTVDALVELLGASNFTRVSSTEIRLWNNVTFDENNAMIVKLFMPELVIDFNGYCLEGMISLEVCGGNVTLRDLGGTNQGGINVGKYHNYPETSDSFLSAPAIHLRYGSLTIESGRYTSYVFTLMAYAGNLVIRDGVFENIPYKDATPPSVIILYAGMSSARIMGGTFRGDGYFTVECYRFREEWMRTSVRNPLQISGGYFENTRLGALAYADMKIDDNDDKPYPDLYELLALGGKFSDGVVNTQELGGFLYSYSAVRLRVEDKGGVESFVYRLYTKVLDREPDKAGFDNWVSRLTSKQATGAEAAYGFIFSPEISSSNLSDQEFVTLLYKVILNRAPDEVGMKNWLSALGMGVSRYFIFAGFANSQEWKNLCARYGIDPGSYASTEPRDQNLQVTIFVRRLYTTCLNREPDILGLNYWTDGLVKKTEDGAHAAFGFFFSKEFESRKLSNEAYVELLYEVLLGRSSDPGGRAYWVGQLNRGVTRLEVFKGFAHSREFDTICAGYGIERGTIQGI